MSSIPPDALENARSETMGLMLAQLKLVARGDRLPVSGAKAVLQDRIKERLNEYAQKRDVRGFDRLSSLISDPENPSTPDRDGHKYLPASAPPKVHASTMANSSRLSAHYTPSASSSSNVQARLNFKESPFFEMLDSVTPIQECKGIDSVPPVRESTRDQLECRIWIPRTIADRFARGEAKGKLKIMIYCAAEPLSVHAKADISFPSQIEIKVNGNELKANLRGLKNKPGSTRPADITELVHKKPNYENIMTVTYALTTKKYYLLVNVVDQITPESLVESLQTRGRITKAQVVAEMVNNAQDPEIQATSSVMSLKCPLSTLRMSVPCRSTICTHNQCYDALSFLQLQEQAPTWMCPVCSKSVSFESLQIDEYVDEILKSTPLETEQVLIEPSGKWSKISTHGSQRHGAHSSSEEDDDLIEIREPSRLAAIRDSSAANQSPLSQTPPQSSREQSSASTIARPISSKRPASAVIDLTFSSDDEDLPRATKRQAPNHSSATSYYPFTSPAVTREQNAQSNSPSYFPKSGGRQSSFGR